MKRDRVLGWSVFLVLMLTSEVLRAQGALTITTATLPIGKEAVPYSFKLEATGGTPPYSWTLPNAGNLLSFFSISADGFLRSNSPRPGTVLMGVQVADAAGGKATRDYYLTIVAKISGWFTGSAAIQGVAYSASLGAIGGVPPYTWALAPGSSLPSRLSLAPNGSITGVPDSVGEFRSKAVVRDSAGDTYTVDILISVQSGLRLRSYEFPDGIVGRPYSAKLEVEGVSSPPYQWSLSFGSLPPGIGFENGVFSGTPTEYGHYWFSVRVTDTKGGYAEVSYQVWILSRPEISTNSLPDGKVGENYLQTLRATRGDGQYSWALVSGTLPPGLALSTTGTLSGKPTSTGQFKPTIGVTDARGGSDTKELPIRIYGTLSATAAALNFVYAGDGAPPPSQTVSVGGSNTGLAFSLIINTADGGKWLSATPASGTTNSTLTVSVTPAGMSNGTYTGNVYVTSNDVSNSPQSVKVTLIITGVYPKATVLNGASFSADGAPIAPGSIATAYGTGFPAQVSLSSVAALVTDTVPPHLPKSISDVAVKINGAPAPLFFAGAGAGIGQAAGVFQVNFQVPLEIEPGPRKVEVLYKDAVVATGSITVSRSAPGVFSLAASGKGQAAALNSDGSLNGDPAKPAVPGTAPIPAAAGGVLVVYATGAGSVLKDYSSGRLAAPFSGQAAACDGSILYATMATPVVTIGGKNAEVLFSGLAPCYVGLWQLNIRVPADLAPGMETPMAITLDQQTSNTTTVAIR